MTLNDTDMTLLKIVGELALKNETDRPAADDIKKEGLIQGINIEDIEDSLIILGEQHYLDVHSTVPQKVVMVKMLQVGFEVYVTNYLADYNELLTQVGQCIQDGQRSIDDIVALVQQSRFLVKHLLDILKHRGYITTVGFTGGRLDILTVSPQLKRWLKSQSE